MDPYRNQFPLFSGTDFIRFYFKESLLARTFVYLNESTLLEYTDCACLARSIVQRFTQKSTPNPYPSC